MGFARDIETLARRVEARADALLRRVARSIAEEVVTRTPVGTGLAASSWFAALDRADPGHQGKDFGGDRPAAMAHAMSQIATAIAGATRSDVITIGNDAAYIRALEHGTSSQAPGGMVATTLAQADRIVERAAEEPSRS